MHRRIQEVLRTHQVGQHQPFGQVFRDFCHQSIHLLHNLVGIRAGGLRNHTRSTGVACNLAVIGISLGTQFHFGHILQAEHFTCRQGLEHHVAKLFCRFIPTPVLERVLKCIFGILAQRTCSRFHVLVVEQRNDIGRHQLMLGHLLGIHPDTHGVIPSHHVHISDSRDTGKTRFYVNLEIVVDKILVVTVVGTVQCQNLHHTVLAFLHGNSHFSHFRRQQSFRFRHTVLRVDSRHVRIGSLRKIHRNGS